MFYSKPLAILIILNFLILPLNASYFVGDPQKQTQNNSRFLILSEEGTATKPSSVIETLWNKVVSTLTSVLPVKRFDFKNKVQSTKLPWWAAADKQASSWQHNWSDLVDHVIELNYYQFKSFFDYLGHKIMNSKTSQEFRDSVHSHSKLITSSFFKMNDIEVNKNNYPQFRDTLIEFFSTLKNRSLPKFIKEDFINHKKFLLEYDNDEEFDGLNIPNADQEPFFHGANHDIFKQSLLLTECLEKIGRYECSEENLPALQNAVKCLYRKMDGGLLQDSSISTLRRLGINVGLSRKVDWSRVSKGLPLLFLIGTASTFNAVAAQRPQFLEDACSGTYKECESAFALLDCCGYTPEISAIKENGYFTYAYNTQGTNLLNNNRNFALDNTRLGIMKPLNTTQGYYSDISAYIASSIPEGNIAREVYTIGIPYLGQSNIPLSPTQYNQTFYQLYGLGNPANFTSSIISGSMNSFYLGLNFNSENWIFAVANQARDFAIGTLVVRPLNGASSYVLWQRLITNATAANRVVPNNLPTTLVSSNKPSAATDRDEYNFDAFLDSLYFGNVDSPEGNNSRTIQKFALDNNLIPNGFIECLQQISLDPLSCSQLTGNGYTRFTNYFVEQRVGLSTVTKNVMDGPNVNNYIYRQLNATHIQALRHAYSWNPTIGTPSIIDDILLDSIAYHQGTLTAGRVEKFGEFYLNNGKGAVVVRVSQSASGSPVSYYAILGPDIISASPTPPTPPSSATPEPSPVTPNSFSPNAPEGDSNQTAIIAGTVVPGVAILATAAGVLGWKLKKNASKKSENDDNRDFELGNTSNAGNEIISNNAFKVVKGKGLKDARLRVTGSMYGKEYGLYFKIDRSEAEEISSQTGLKIDFSDFQEEMDLVLGAGNFGQVRVAKEEATGQYTAIKIVVGEQNVKASLREGALQARLNGNENVLPLLEYLHYEPTSNNKKEMKQLLEATFGSTIVKGEDMTSQDLLLQVSPLAALGNGYDFLDRLGGLNDINLKDRLLRYFTFSLLTGLKNMHDNGVSHLDIKPTNILFASETIYVSDFGCALQKNRIVGGIGDFSYFSPERMAHVRFQENNKGHTFIAQETAKTFSGQAADAFAAGLTLLEFALNFYPLGIEESAYEMVNKRDSAYFSAKLKQAYEQVDKKLRILRIIEGLLIVDPKERWSITKAQAEALKLKPEVSPKHLFEEFDTAVLEELPSPRKEAGNANTGSANYARSFYKDEKANPSQMYGADLPSYEQLQKAYKDEQGSLINDNDVPEERVSVPLRFAPMYNTNES